MKTLSCNSLEKTQRQVKGKGRGVRGGGGGRGVRAVEELGVGAAWGKEGEGRRIRHGHRTQTRESSKGVERSETGSEPLALSAHQRQPTTIGQK